MNLAPVSPKLNYSPWTQVKGVLEWLSDASMMEAKDAPALKGAYQA